MLVFCLFSSAFVYGDLFDTIVSENGRYNAVAEFDNGDCVSLTGQRMRFPLSITRFVVAVCDAFARVTVVTYGGIHHAMEARGEPLHRYTSSGRLA